MSLQITTTSGDPEHPGQIIAFAEPDPPTGYTFTDVDGDRIGVWPASIPDVGRGVNIRTDRLGCSIPRDEVEAFIQAVRDGRRVMSADNSWSGRVTITPPLTWRECRLSPAVEDVRLDIHEEDGPDGKILTAVAVLPARPSNQWGGHTGDELRSLINAHPGHEFTGSLRVDWDPVYGDDQVLAERWTVDGRSVVHETARLVWSVDE